LIGGKWAYQRLADKLVSLLIWYTISPQTSPSKLAKYLKDLMKKIDIFTVVISSITLLLFCACSYWLLHKYNDIKTSELQRTSVEIAQIEQTIDQLTSQESVGSESLIAVLQSTQKLLEGSQGEWQILKQTLNSFVIMLFVIVLFHLAFVWTLFRGRRG
jgi:hypothetical protein